MLMTKKLIVIGLAVWGMMLAGDLRAEENPAAVAAPRATTGKNRYRKIAGKNLPKITLEKRQFPA